MVYVERTTEGQIFALYASPQEETAEEFLSEEDPEVVAFRARFDTLEDDLPPPAVLVMSTSNVHIDGEDVNVTGGGFNFGGAMRDGPGLYALFTLIPLSGTAFDPWFSVGGGFTLKATVVDPYLVMVEATDINGNPADPEFFSMRIYQP